jgi:DcaP outer membrane protein
MRRTILRFALMCCMGGVLSFAQTQDTQLQEKIQQLEQLTQELKARLATLEKSQPGAPQAANSNATQPAGAQEASQQSATENAPGTVSAKTVPAKDVAVSAAPANPNGISSAPKPQSSPREVKVALSASGPGDEPASTAGQPKETTRPPANPQDAPPQPPPPEEKVGKPEMEIYGFAMLDMGYDFGQVDPNWFDVMRPIKLPSFHNEFGENGRLYTGVRQSRFGVKTLVPTQLGQLKTVFEFELFGVGAQAGETNFRLRHAYGELGQFLAGQTWSPFMDPDVFPNSIEYWGPNGMVFFRNVQFRWQPINKGNKQVYIALERPGATADLGRVQDRDIIQGVQFRFPAPDVSGRVRYGGERSYLQLSGLFRYIAWDDLKGTATTNLGGHTYGWGVHGSSNVGVGQKDTIKLSVVYGHGVENYMNDAPVDVAPKIRRGDLRTPIGGDALPVLGVVAFYDRYWSERWSSTAGYSLVNIDNVPLQLSSSFHQGHYAIVDLLFYPVKNVMMGAEYIWGRRENFSDGFTVNDNRIQFSFRYNFSLKYGGEK